MGQLFFLQQFQHSLLEQLKPFCLGRHRARPWCKTGCESPTCSRNQHQTRRAQSPLPGWEYPCCGLGAGRILAAWERVGARGPVMPDRFVWVPWMCVQLLRLAWHLTFWWREVVGWSCQELGKARCDRSVLIPEGGSLILHTYPHEFLWSCDSLGEGALQSHSESAPLEFSRSCSSCPQWFRCPQQGAAP